MNETTNSKFAGCTIVATGKLENFTRDGINAKIISLGATPGSSVTKKTDYLICGGESRKQTGKGTAARRPSTDRAGVHGHDRFLSIAGG